MSETKQISVQKSAEAAAAKAAELFRETIRQAVQQRGRCAIALAGGTTPRLMYQRLADEAVVDRVPWGQVDLFFGDERDVPQDDVESNFGVAQKMMLDHLPIDWERVHPMRADADDLDSASDEYEQIIRRVVPAGPDGIPQFDLVMLGMGGDGHTASLFPDSPILGEGKRLVVACHVPVLGRNRMTMTFPLINASRHIVMLVTGDDKAGVVERVIRQEDQSLPAARVYPVRGTLHYVLDTAAARLL